MHGPMLNNPLKPGQVLGGRGALTAPVISGVGTQSPTWATTGQDVMTAQSVVLSTQAYISQVIAGCAGGGVVMEKHLHWWGLIS